VTSLGVWGRAKLGDYIQSEIQCKTSESSSCVRTAESQMRVTLPRRLGWGPSVEG